MLYDFAFVVVTFGHPEMRLPPLFIPRNRSQHIPVRPTKRIAALALLLSSGVRAQTLADRPCTGSTTRAPPAGPGLRRQTSQSAGRISIESTRSG
jgi:hypothetical protein